MNFLTIDELLNFNKEGEYYCRRIDDYKKIYNYIVENNKRYAAQQKQGFEIIASRIIIYNIIDFKNAIIFYLLKKNKI